mmetsp:Transcript_10250/g.25750  ORF Transcript_10250/g.25750 Transcript_10250/m.25750 type:complete len:936 (-) Transcript_10250:199-3006(-)|eukprot:CAMPEP_0174230496 /NCGR_PEP_ID=MMETSP0417-20130205/1238_1 /TAXON_ID=242541 /ORGANISM="Mayorella sp, Strain BSH-02190019" /LENGTH=935 /DNA_ID=CAMNT_0015308195 /DNA_START=115 /DNA_END=2922 /DNA_ORIENTATION=+
MSDSEQEDKSRKIDASLREKRWVEVQKKGFTAWVNSYLSKKSMEVKELETDLRSGVKLVVFLECLAGRRIAGVDRKPGIKVQEIQNLSLSLKFIQQDLKVRLLGIGPEDLYQGNMKLILGMLWSLFRSRLQEGFGGASDDGKNKSTEDGLLEWIRKMTDGYDHVNVTDFKTSFNDGMAFNALIHRFNGDLVDYGSLDPANAAENLEAAFEHAEKHLGIPKLLNTDDLINGTVDERSVILYSSLYFHAFASAQETKVQTSAVTEAKKKVEEELAQSKKKVIELETAQADLQDKHNSLLDRFANLEAELEYLRQRTKLDNDGINLLEGKVATLGELLEKEQFAKSLAQEDRERLQSERDQLLNKKGELEAGFDSLSMTAAEREASLRMLEERRQMLQKELENLRRVVADETARRIRQAKELAALREENSRLQKKVIVQSRARAGLDTLKRNLEEHLEDMYKWRQLNNLEKGSNEFDLQKVVGDITDKSFDEQVTYLDEKLQEENQALLRIIKLQNSEVVIGDKVDKEGWLLIKGRKEWKKRWFKLTGNRLAYFESDTHEQFEGCVDLSVGCEVVRQKAVKEEGNSKKLWPLKLTVEPNRKLFIRAPSKQERHSWFSLISVKVAHINYIKEAEATGNRPDTRIISFLHTQRLPELFLDSHKVYPEGLSAVTKALPAHDTMAHLSISNAKIGNEGIAKLSAVFPKLSLTELRLGGNQIGNDGLVTMLKSLPATLTELHLNDNEIGTEGALALAGALSGFKNLQVLNLSGNTYLEDEGVKALVEAVRDNHFSVPVLQLNNTGCGDEGANAVAELLSANAPVVEAQLSHNKITNQGAKAIAKALLSNTNLHVLDLSDNEIAPAGAEALTASLRDNYDLVKLDLSKNDLLVGSAKLGNLLTKEGFSFPGLSFSRVPAVAHDLSDDDDDVPAAATSGAGSDSE